MDYKNTANELLKEIGGEGNVNSVTHCQTRMRFVLKDESRVDDEKVKAIKGVMGIARKGGQYQVIIGTDVADCYAEFRKLGNFGGEGKGEEVKKKLTVKSLVNGMIDAIAGSLAPILPAIIGGGMVKLVVTILNLLNVSSELPTYQILSVIGDASFYFLPILLAASAAKKFGCNQAIAMTFAAVLVHPNLITLLANGNTTFLTIPVTAATYSSSVLPVLLMTWLLSKIEPVTDKYMKGWVKTIVKPMVLFLIGIPICLVIVAPIGSFLGDGLAWILNTLQSRIGWLMIGLASAFMPLIVMSGMHYALIPNCVTTLGNYGFETILGPTMLASNFAQASASAAVAWRTKNKELKAVATTSAVSAFVAGITEPALYGVTMRLKKPLIASMIGSGLAGLFAGIVGLQNYALTTPAAVSIVQFVSSTLKWNIVFALITAAISVVVTFILTLVLGWDDPANEGEASPEELTAIEQIKEDVISSPIPGEIIPLTEIEDETFASGVLGQGIAIRPKEGKVYAPFDGTISSIFETKHAISLTSTSGIEVLIHFGLETVNLKGEGFSPVIKEGQQVKRGELLMNVDMDVLKKKNIDTTTAVVIPNSDDFQEIRILAWHMQGDRTTQAIEVVRAAD